MALVLADRVKETTTTAGTGTVTLLGASAGFQSFAVIGDANTTYYTIAGQSEWEVGIGTYTSSGTTLARTTVLSNSSGTQPSALSFSAGTKDVFVTYPSGKSVNLDASGNATALGTPAAFVGTNITGTASGLTAGNVTTNANLTGGVTSVGNAATVVTNANLTGGVTSVGNATTVVTNANLTGDVTSSGNATTLATVNANVGAFTFSSITVNAKGLVTAASSGSAPAEFVSGTRITFNQTAAPTGWTKSTTDDNKSLRVVTGTVGTGGSVAFTTAFASQTPAGSVSVSGGSVGATTLTTSQIPSHQHSLGLWRPNVQDVFQGGSQTPGARSCPWFSTGGSSSNPYEGLSVAAGSGSSHTHGFTTPTASFSGSAINLAVQYVDVIIAAKN